MLVWLWRLISGNPCSFAHHGKILERLRVERAGAGRFAAGAVLERSMVCRDCGEEVIPWSEVGPPMDAIALGVILEPAEWHKIATGGKLYFLPDGADTFDAPAEISPKEH